MANVGFCKKIITPKKSVGLCGYACERMSTGVHDDLYTRVMVFEVGNFTSVWVSLEVLSIDHLMIERIKDYLNEYEVPFDDLEVFTIHTHSGPQGISDDTQGPLKNFLGKTDHELIDMIASQSALAAKEAYGDMKACIVKAAKGIIDGVGKNRHEEHMPSDDTLLAVEIVRVDKKKAMLFNFACHPTVLHEDNLLISADFIGAAHKQLEDTYDFSMFINGSCGDISTRFTRKSSTMDELDRYGKIVKDAIEMALDQPFFYGSVDNFKVERHVFELEAKRIDSVEDALQKLTEAKQQVAQAKAQGLSGSALRVVESAMEGATLNLIQAENNDGQRVIEVPVNILRFGAIKAVTIPGELFCTLSNELKQNHPVFFFGYANGYIGYIADMSGYDRGYYEAMSSFLKRGEGEHLIEMIEHEVVSF